jgi:large subunit ribosomal protein L24
MAATKQKQKIRYTKSAKAPRVKKGGNLLVSKALVKTSARNTQAKLHVNKGDEVVVISGNQKGTIAKVLEVFRSEGKIIVEGVNIVKKHSKARAAGQEGEIMEIESPIFASKVMLWDEQNKKASRVAHKVLGGKKVRVYKTTGEQID